MTDPSAVPPTGPRSEPTGGAPTRPATTTAAVAAMWALAVIGLLGMVLVLASQDQVRELMETELAGQPGALSPELVETSLLIGTIGAVVSGLVGTVLWVLLAVFCGRGAGWARVVATVLGVLNVLGGAWTLTQPAPGLSQLLTVVGMVLAAAAVVLLWLPASRAWFAAVAARRRGVPAGPPPTWGPTPTQ